MTNDDLDPCLLAPLPLGVMSEEIERLRTALAERDATIERLTKERDEVLANHQWAQDRLDDAEARAIAAEEEVELLKAAIFGAPNYDADLTTGCFVEMARSVEAARQGALDRATAAERERDEARQIVRDIYWMAIRYADGRQTYAVGMVNDALDKAYGGGWLEHHGSVGDYAYARDGASPEYLTAEARQKLAEAQRDELAAKLRAAEAALKHERDEARAEVERKDAALAPFADMADYIDAETEGVSDADEVDVMFHDFLFAHWPVSHFRSARAALTAKGGENGGS